MSLLAAKLRTPSVQPASPDESSRWKLDEVLMKTVRCFRATCPSDADISFVSVQTA